MANMGEENWPPILLTGGSGYVGGRLIPLLEKQGVKLRCLARSPEKMRSLVNSGTEIVQGDVPDPASIDRALQGVQVLCPAKRTTASAAGFHDLGDGASLGFGDSNQ